MKFRMLPFLRRLDQNTIPELCLCSCWFAGSSLGFFAERFFGDTYVSFLRLIPSQIPDWSGMFASAVFPIFLSTLACFVFHSAACYLGCLVRGFGQGLMIGMINALYGTGAVLMVILLMFTALCVNPLMLLFWLRQLGGNHRTLLTDAGLCTVAALFVGVIDILVIAPFLVDVINL